MLLTVPQRRRLIADLRRDGYTPRTVIAVLLLDALVLGLLACVLGLALGEELSIHLLALEPGVPLAGLRGRLAARRELAERRDRGRRRHARGDRRGAQPAARHPLARPARRDRLAAKAARRGARGGPAGARRAWSASLRATALLLSAPQAAIAGMVLLVAALLLELPLALGATLALVRRLAQRDHEPRPARRGDGAERRSRASRRDRGDRRDRGLRQRRDRGRARRSARGPGKRGARHERVHRRLGRACRLLQPAA